MVDIEQKDVDLTQNNEEGEVLENESDKQEEKPQAPQKREFTTEEKLARVARLKQRYEKELGIEPTPQVVVERKVEPSKPKTGELDETQLEILELRGITAKEDIDVLTSVMEKTGMTLRQALKDDYVNTKLAANKDKRAIETAMPGASGRSSPQKTTVEQALADYEKTGKLPDDFELRAQVIDARAREGNDKIPPWRR